MVEEVKVVTQDENRAAFLIRLSPGVPQFAPVNNNPTRPELLLRSTVRSPRVPQRSIVRSTSLEPSESGLAFRIDAAAPAQVTAEPAGDNRLQVVVTRLSEGEATGVRPIGTTAEEVVPASEISAYNPAVAEGVMGDSYERYRSNMPTSASSSACCSRARRYPWSRETVRDERKHGDEEGTSGRGCCPAAGRIGAAGPGPAGRR